MMLRQGLRHRAELVGESVREIGVLLLVFVPLDSTFYPEKIDWAAQIGLVILASAGLGLIAIGVLIEGRWRYRDGGSSGNSIHSIWNSRDRPVCVWIRATKEVKQASPRTWARSPP
jgi:hypothetical protein